MIATAICFAVLDTPQWVSSVWALFMNEPMVPWLLKHNFPHLAFSPWWDTAPVGAAMFLTVVVIEYKVPFVSKKKLKPIQERRAKLVNSERPDTGPSLYSHILTKTLGHTDKIIEEARQRQIERQNVIKGLVDEAIRLIREDKITFTLYALQRAGIGMLHTEKEFLVVREMMVHRNQLDPLKGLSLPNGPTWLTLVKFANERETHLHSDVAVYDCTHAYFTQRGVGPQVVTPRQQTREERHETHPVYVAIRQLKALLAEGDRMANKFQIRSEPNPTLKEVTKWLGRVNKCAEQNALWECIGVSDIKKLNEEWDHDDAFIASAVLYDLGYFERFDDDSGFAFRTIWGYVRRLQELMATIEKTTVDQQSLLMLQTHEKLAAELETINEKKRLQQ